MLRLSRQFNGPYKVDLPESMLEGMLGNGEAFSSPLIFRIESQTNHVAAREVEDIESEGFQPEEKRQLYQFVGVREFTAEAGEFGANETLASDLGLMEGDEVNIECVELPKGTELTLDMLTDYTASVDIKSLLESWIPKNYTALSLGQELRINYLGQTHRLKVNNFKPETSEAVCIIDTDMDLLLNEPTSIDESAGHGHAVGDDLHTIELGKSVTSSNTLAGEVPRGIESMFFTCTEIGVIGPSESTSETSFVAVSNNEEVEVPVELLGAKFSVKGKGELLVSDKSSKATPTGSTDTSQCQYCGNQVPTQNFVLHQNFCARNSVKCTTCHRNFGQTRTVPDWHAKWHSLVDSSLTETTPCGSEMCSFEGSSQSEVAFHRATDCINRPILCQFCHLLVPQGETSPVDRVMGLTAHEAQCGNRTTTCYICDKRVRIRSLEVHLQDHEIQRRNRPVPEMCSNQNCPNVYPQEPEHLCQACFGPLSVPGANKDPEKLKQRVMRRYILQMTRGCSKPWCLNQYCAMNGKRTAKDATKVSQEIMQDNKHWFCVDQDSTQKRMFVDFDEGSAYAQGWRALAISQSSSETGATQWLEANVS